MVIKRCAKGSKKVTSCEKIGKQNEILSFIPGRAQSFCGITTKEVNTFAKKFKISQKIINDYIGKNNKQKGESICEAIHVLFPEFVHKLTKVLGEGAFGYVFATEGERGEKNALKVIREGGGEDVKKEVKMGKIFEKMGIAPKFIAYRQEFVQEKSGRDIEVTLHFLEMSRIDDVVENYLKKKLTKCQIAEVVSQIFKVIEKLRINGYVHGDLHLENIGYVASNAGTIGKLQIIDYGRSAKIEAPQIDIIQLIRGIRLASRVPKSTKVYFEKLVREKAKRNYGLELPRFTHDRFEELLLDEYDENGI